VHDAHGVDRDVDAARLRRDGIGVLGNRSLVERIDLRGLRSSASSDDVGRDGIESRLRAPGEEDPGAFPREDARDPPADGPSASVDHGVLVLQQHLGSLPGSVGLGLVRNRWLHIRPESATDGCWSC
jgi:hypothetical protein